MKKLKPEWKEDAVDYYATLQVGHDASPEQIRSQRNKLAREAQQLSPSEGHELFAIINEAYAVLSDSSTRERYDAYMQRKFDPDWKL